MPDDVAPPQPPTGDMLPNFTLNRAARQGQPTEDRKLLS